MSSAYIDEVFASIQGEGPSVGRRHIFTRFIGCDLRCGFCDTPGAVLPERGEAPRSCRAQMASGSFERELLPNPIDMPLLTILCERLRVPGSSRPVLSLTGGEPLLQVAFLREWLPAVAGTFQVYLETNGIHADALQRIAALVDVVSMDLKLPSATGEKPRWEEHRRFLEAAQGRETVVKVVITAGTVMDDIIEAAELVAELDRSLPFVIQPAGGNQAPPAERLMAMQNRVLTVLEDVRVIPQVHRLLQVP